MNTQQNANKADGQTPSEALAQQTRISMLQRKAERLQRELSAMRAERRLDAQDAQEWIEADSEFPLSWLLVGLFIGAVVGAGCAVILQMAGVV